MMLLTPVIIGAIVGPLVAIAFGRHRFAIHNAVLGILGALILRILAYLILAANHRQSNGFSFVGVLSSLVGAALLPYIFKLFPPIKAHKEK